MKVTYIQPDGSEQTVEAKPGDSVMQAAIAANVPGIVAECGGSMACATCHVYVDDAWTSRTGTRSESEEDMLDCAMSEMKDSSRLSCQLRLTDEMDGLTVHIPEEQF
ncbi:2Fe-2S iron-sulfur cluster-binding protein [Vannielia litorea]|uniref:2Fe-2S iron-sulfur cluster-binding protein n=1 Tax=Vannielia litorea TaxID=1217970 RepID=UPI001C978889|nr:2Fe-2S iron-sulfur cluster-binding protein [Vannielia litorea]MBY6049003.1 2Fe-2S iron-sulfur cluster binding domain-containing protein [Vannielia litorea]MBY6076417.1 2Fe-2S iron-sulfur cluster binding domain-containing protein [Vannielia litorea]